MSTMIKRWATTAGFDKGAKVEMYQYSDGSIHYGFRDRLGRSSNLKDKAEADKVIKIYHMEMVVERKVH